MAAGLQLKDRTITVGYRNLAILTSYAVELATYRGPLPVIYAPI